MRASVSDQLVSTGGAGQEQLEGLRRNMEEQVGGPGRALVMGGGLSVGNVLSLGGWGKGDGGVDLA